MFEDAMMESSGRIVTRSKYYTIFGALLNGCLMAALVLVPLFHPEALPRNALTALLVAPAPPPAAPPPAPQIRVARVVPQASEFTAPSRIPKLISMTHDTAEPPSADLGVQGMGENATSPADLLVGLPSGNAASVVVKAVIPRKVSISQGVMAGNILSKPQPTYPAVAKQARIQGTVILSATISKTGTIENLTVLSGPQMLSQSALEAVRNWRYKPYLLNGEPVEVQTTVNVTFTLGG